MSSPMKKGDRNESLKYAPRKVKVTQNERKPVTYMDADQNLLLDTIETVGRAGGALRFGRTRDKESLCIGVYGDGDPYNLYVGPTDNVNQILAAIRNGFSADS